MSVLCEDIAPPMCVLQIKYNLGAMLRFGNIRQKCQHPKTAVFGQDDQFSDSAHYRHPEVEPDIKSGLQGYLFVALP